jgi:GLPGLI family protein
MKQFLFAIALLPSVLFSQKQGEITYKEISKFEIPEQYKQYASNMPDSIVKETILLFTESKSIYKNYENLDAQVDPEGGQWWMMWFKKDIQTYKDFESKRKIEKQDFMDKTFLINEELSDTTKWKVKPSDVVILGYPCMKATTARDSTEITAWFTTQIPVSNGPSMSGGLPGMILKIEVPFGRPGGRGGSGTMVIIADKVTLREVGSKEIQEPKKGKQVTREEYNTIVKTKMEEMRKSGNSWGR